MSRFLMRATISVEADDEKEALHWASYLCNMADRLGLGDCVLDMSKSPELDRDTRATARERGRSR